MMPGAETVKVYVPNPDMPEHVAIQTGSIEPKSGIVGESAKNALGEEIPGGLLIYYEGNLYGAANIITFADRVQHAAGRMAYRAPTIAKRAVHPMAVTHVADFYTDHGRVEVLPNGRFLTMLVRWLELGEPGDPGVGDTLHRELRCSDGWSTKP